MSSNAYILVVYTNIFIKQYVLPQCLETFCRLCTFLDNDLEPTIDKYQLILCCPGKAGATYIKQHITSWYHTV